MRSLGIIVIFIMKKINQNMTVARSRSTPAT